MAYAAIGENDNAFEWFEKAVEDRNEWMIWFGTDPKLDELRKDSRYFELLQKTNNPIIASQNVGSANDASGKINRRFAFQTFEFGKYERFRRRIFKHRSGGRFDDAAFKCAAFSCASDKFGFAFRQIRKPIRLPPDANSALILLWTEISGASAIEFASPRNFLNVCENSTHWAERFDEKCTDVLTLEDSISERVTKCLLPKLTGEEHRQLAKRGTKNPKPMKHICAGDYFWNQFTPEAFPKAIESFQKAVELDQNYALAYVGIADFYKWATIYGLFPPQSVIRKFLPPQTVRLKLTTN